MANALQIKRGTRAQIDAAAASGQLKAGEPYFITDEDRVAVGISTTTYESFAKESEAGGSGGWGTISDVSLASSAQEIEVTGLSGYKDLRLFWMGRMNNTTFSNYDLRLYCRASAGSWREMLKHGGVYSGSCPAWGRAEIFNFGNQDGSGVQIVHGEAAVDTNYGPDFVDYNKRSEESGVQFASSIAANSRDETWDEISLYTNKSYGFEGGQGNQNDFRLIIQGR